MAQWYEDGEFARLFDSRPAFPKTENAMNKWIDSTERDHEGFALAVRLLYSDDMIGYVDISGIQWTHGTGWLTIGIGNPAHRNKGFGTEAMHLTLRFAFSELNLHRLQLTVFSYNEGAIHLYEGLGFTREGAYREHLLRDGKRYDMLLYGMLASEWRARNT
nr:GNAT family acetyltransferase [uncultured bacterium]